MVSAADLDVAKKTIKIKSSNFCMSFISVLWRGEVLMCCFNNISKEIMSIFSSRGLEPEDVEHLEYLIKNTFALDI